MKLIRLLLLAVCGCAAVAAPGEAQTAPTPETLTVQQQTELETLTRQLRDADRTAQTKFEAATILLTRSYPQAHQRLAQFLIGPENTPARLAVAGAIASSGLTHPQFVEPLLAMIRSEQPELRQAAAGALGAYKDPAVIEQLAALAGDGSAGVDQRLSAISALSRILDRRAVDALITLLDSHDPAVRAATGEALGTLTGIHSFGADPVRWRDWWELNKHKDRQQWLEDLLESLSRQNAQVEAEAGRLRSRLGESLAALYESTAGPDRPGLLMNYLNDPLPAVRLAGLELSLLRVRRDEPLAPDAGQRVRALLDDDDAPVRSAATTLLARLNDPEATNLLLARLEGESSGRVREALVTALGELRAAEAVDALLSALQSEPNGVAVAAARALSRVAESSELPPAQADRAAEVLTARFERSNPAQAALREAMLEAMGAFARPAMQPMIAEALTDPMATVRLAAVRAAAAVGTAELAEDVAALADDSDRGVRLAVVVALGRMSAAEFVETILNRTRADVESDPTIRQRAWEIALSLLAEAPPEQLAHWAERLKDWPNASSYRIRLLTMLLDRLSERPAEQLAVRVDLAEALLAAGRSPEAAAQLALAVQQAGPEEPQGGVLWVRWIAALLAAEDPTALAEIAGQSDPQLRALAIEKLLDRLAALQQAQGYQGLIALASAAQERLGEQLSEEQRRAVAEALAAGQAAQRDADASRVAQLLAQWPSAEPAEREAIESELLAMRTRAVEPLLAELARLVEAETPDRNFERAVASLLMRIEPDFGSYDPDAAMDARRRTVQRWQRRNAGPATTTTAPAGM